jgi:hypothetical protein
LRGREKLSAEIGVGFDKLGDVADGRGLGLDLSAIGAPKAAPSALRSARVEASR